VSGMSVLAVWAVLAVALIGLEVAAHTRRDRVPAMTDVLDWLARTSPGRWFLVLGWAWLGWHWFVR
jgi:hypothetical protein